MVGFGESLLEDGRRRPGWEDAYLDYDSLKSILHEMVVISKSKRHKHKRPELLESLKNHFLHQLDLEIEKVRSEQP